jgi:thymidylate synthase (FAD)
MSNREILWKSESSVETISSNLSDSMVVKAARVSTKGSDSRGEESDRGLIEYLLKNKHWSPFDHGSMTFLVHCPVFVSREFLRHRSWTFNETSGRYKELDPVFYLPTEHRPLQQEGKPGHYKFVEGTPEQQELVKEKLIVPVFESYMAYLDMLEAGVAREVARMVLPVSIFTSFYATATARSIMHFLELRDDPAAQYEIQQVAKQIGALFEAEMPVTAVAYREVKNK